MFTKFVVGKPEGKRPLGGPRHRWDNNIKEIGWEGVDRIRVAQGIDLW
jgi:hypothetical protein